jgi:hypothetical protein
MKWHSRVISRPLFWNADQQLMRANLAFALPSWVQKVKVEVTETPNVEWTEKLLDTDLRFTDIQRELKVA